MKKIKENLDTVCIISSRIFANSVWFYNFSFLIHHKFNMTQRDFVYPSYLDKAHRVELNAQVAGCSKYNTHMELF